MELGFSRLVIRGSGLGRVLVSRWGMRIDGSTLPERRFASVPKRRRGAAGSPGLRAYGLRRCVLLKLRLSTSSCATPSTASDDARVRSKKILFGLSRRCASCCETQGESGAPQPSAATLLAERHGLCEKGGYRASDSRWAFRMPRHNSDGSRDAPARDAAYKHFLELGIGIGRTEGWAPGQLG